MVAARAGLKAEPMVSLLAGRWASWLAAPKVAPKEHESVESKVERWAVERVDLSGRCWAAL